VNSPNTNIHVGLRSFIVQAEGLRQRFDQALNVYQQAEKQHRDKQKERMARQFGIGIGYIFTELYHPPNSCTLQSTKTQARRKFKPSSTQGMVNRFSSKR